MAKTDLEKLDEALKKEEQILGVAVAKSLTQYNKNPTSSNLRDYQANKRALEEYRAKASGKETDTFSTKGKVLIYLEAEGWDVKKSKLYNDLRSVPKTKGNYHKKDVDMYAKLRLTKANGAEVCQDNAEKTRQEIRVAAARAEKLEMENDILRGKYQLKSNVNRELVARMIQLKKDEKTDNKVKSADIISLVGGDIEKEKELQKFLNDGTDRRMNTYAKPFKFSVSMTELEKEIAAIEEEEKDD